MLAAVRRGGGGQQVGDPFGRQRRGFGGGSRFGHAGASDATRTGVSAGPRSTSQHAADCPPPRSNNGGSSTRQRSNATGQRGWKRQPVGMWAASGVSPSRIVRHARLPATGGDGGSAHE